MPTPIEAYREGYEKGLSDSTGGRLAEITMSTLRDDPGGHFQNGYADGSGGRLFNPPAIATPNRFQAKGLIPKFSENPIGWLFGVLVVIELWVLWQLIKAPFQLLRSLMRSEKPSASVIAKNAIVAVLISALVWWGPRLNDRREAANDAQVLQPTIPAQPRADVPLTTANIVGAWRKELDPADAMYIFSPNGNYTAEVTGRNADGTLSSNPPNRFSGTFSLSGDVLTTTTPEETTKARIAKFDGTTLVYCTLEIIVHHCCPK